MGAAARFRAGRSHGFAVIVPCRKGPRHAFKRAIGRQAARVRNGGRRLFSAAGRARLCIAKQNSRRPPSSAALRPLSLRSAVQARCARRQVIAVKAAMGAVDPTRDITMPTDRDDTDLEPRLLISHRSRARRAPTLWTSSVQDEPDPRPLPEANAIGGAVADIFDALIATLRDTRLGPTLRPALVGRQPLPPRRRPRPPRA